MAENTVQRPKTSGLETAPLAAGAQAHANIALVKYWGKRDSALNLPAVGSLSLTLDALWTRTRCEFDPSLDEDRLVLDGAESAQATVRVSAFLDLVRALAGADWRAKVVSQNNFPTGAGLASSASGFAALALASTRALGLELTPERLSELARRGSGSAARSVYGGFVEMQRGRCGDGRDAIAHPLLAAKEWPLEVVVAVTTGSAKAVGSTDGMTRTARTSPYYDAWVAGADGDLDEARRAVNFRDFEALAAVSEQSALKMHALALAARPGLIYWNAATVTCLHRIRELRDGGTGVFFTVDAGPQVKAVCLPGAGRQVAAALAAVGGVGNVMVSGLGEGVRPIEHLGAAS